MGEAHEYAKQNCKTYPLHGGGLICVTKDEGVRDALRQRGASFFPPAGPEGFVMVEGGPRHWDLVLPPEKPDLRVVT